MPALIKAEDILKDEQIQREIELICYELEDGQDIPKLNIIVNDKTREAYRKARSRYLMPKIFQKQGSRGFELKLEDNSVEFVMAILRFAYSSAENWIDKPTMEIIEKYLVRTQTVSKFLANALSSIFEEEEHIKKVQDEEDEKNL